MANRNLLILGAGQYGMVAKEIAESMQFFEKIDFLDDNNRLAIGKLENYEAYVKEYSYAVVAIGNAEVRLSYLQRLETAEYLLATLVSPHAYVAPSARIAKGAIVEPMAVINSNAFVATGVIICAGAIVNHNATVDEGCLLQCGSVVTAGAQMTKRLTLDYGKVLK